MSLLVACALPLGAGCGGDSEESTADAAHTDDTGVEQQDAAANNGVSQDADPNPDTDDEEPLTLEYSQRLKGAGEWDGSSVVMDDDLYFSWAFREFWRTDGTEAGTVKLADVGFPGSPVVFDGQIIGGGVTDMSTLDYSLWKSDGTAEGTVQYADQPGSIASLTVFNEAVYFFSSPGRNSVSQLWKTDGTEAGTTKVAELDADADHSSARDMTVVGDTLFFVVVSDNTRRQLWKTDGTEQGTEMVKRAEYTGDGVRTVVMRELTALGAKLLYLSESSDQHLFISDGTEAGTREIAQFEDGVTEFVVAGDAAFFQADDGDNDQGGHQYELWKTDGTEAGTVIVKDIVPYDPDNILHSSYPRNLAALGDTLIFTAESGEERNRQLWKSDGTEEGTVVVKPEVEGEVQFEYEYTGSGPDGDMLAVGERLFFRCEQKNPLEEGAFGQWDYESRGYELCITDGTEAGTRVIEEFRAGDGGGSPSRFMVGGDTLYYTAADIADESPVMLYALDLTLL